MKDMLPPQPPPQERSRILKLAILGFVVFVSVCTGLFLASSKNSESKQNLNTASNGENAAIQIEITKDGFVPQSVTVLKGTKVTWINKDTNPHQIVSDPDPNNPQNPGLNSKTLTDTGNEFSSTFNQAGTTNYHDSLNPSLTGVLSAQ